MKKIKVAILGSGNIGTDLLMKIMRSKNLECCAFIGRNIGSNGMRKAQQLNVTISGDGIDYIKNNPDCCDIVFDATSAQSHLEHAVILRNLGKVVIDLTPSKIGKMAVFAVNGSECLEADNINMITCGGQASIPIAYLIGKIHSEVEYIEVVSSIASNSAGPATRLNLDEYIETTEFAVKIFSKSKQTKAILNLNPAFPSINMQTTVFAKVKNPQLQLLQEQVDIMVKNIQQYVPGYELLVGPVVENDRIVIMVKVTGLGDYLPKYAGNLDIINCAALAMAELIAKKMLKANLAKSYA